MWGVSAPNHFARASSGARRVKNSGIVISV
jgi:hypothetical protein